MWPDRQQPGRTQRLRDQKYRSSLLEANKEVVSLGTSNPATLTPVGKYLRAYRPKSVLDIGIGFGKWGFLAREYLDVWDGRYRIEDWQTRIEGVEIYKEYITPLHEYVYDEIHIGDVRKLATTIQGPFDLVLAVDVLEHLPGDDVLMVLDELLRRHRATLVNVPAGGRLTLHPHGRHFENEHEQHLSHWSRQSLRKAGAVQVRSNLASHLALFTRDPLVPRFRRITLQGTAVTDRAETVIETWRAGGAKATLQLIRDGARHLLRQ